MTKSTKNNVRVFNTVAGLNHAAAQLIIDVAAKATEQRKRFTICLSGGNTPEALYKLLAAEPYIAKIDWKNTFVFWGDERCVPFEDERNNAHMATVTLLRNVPIPSFNIFSVPTELPPADAALAYEQMIHSFFGNEEPRFDLMLMGIGENGHTASLFPGTPVLHEKIRWVKEVVVNDNVAGVDNRITLTAPLINKARHILFLVTGEGKAEVLNTILNGAYLPEKYPAQLIQAEEGKLLWFVDEKAADKLKR